MYSITRISGAALVGVVNELSAQYRDNKIAPSLYPSDVANRDKMYVVLVGAMIIGIPLWAASDMGWLSDVGEGAFDGLAAVVGRNVANNVGQRAVGGHVPL
jgi:hypothetical protein